MNKLTKEWRCHRFSASKKAKIWASTLFCVFGTIEFAHGGAVVIRDNLMGLGAYNNSLGQKGYLDVTTLGADPSGNSDSSTAIQNAIDEAYMHNLICFFPSGTYKVSQQLKMEQKRDLMTDVFALVGSAAGPRPVIKLANGSSGFTAVNSPKVLFWFKGVEQLPPGAPNPTASPVLPSAGGNQADAYGGTYNQLFRNIDIDLGNNAGAIGVRMHACQGSTVQDVKVTGTNFYAGFRSAVGAGAMMGNLEVVGGRYGVYLAGNEGPGVHFSNCPMITGLTLTNQTNRAIYTPSSPGYSPITIAGFHITKANGPALTINGSNGNNKIGGQTSLIDGVIELTNSGTAITNPDASIYMQNVYFKNSGIIINNTKGDNKIGNSSGWTRVPEYSFYDKANTSVIDGSKKTWNRVVPDIDSTNENVGPGDIRNLLLRHVWDDTIFPHFEGDVYTTLYPNGSNDTAQIQNAINAANGKVVFLARGVFKINGTITLKADTKLIGASKHLTTIQALDSWGTQPSKTPMLSSPADANASTLIANFRIKMPRNQMKKIYWLEWQSGRHSMIRDMWFYKQANWTGSQNSANMQRLWIHGPTAGGRIYGLFTRTGDGDSKNTNFRYLLIENTAEPLYIYAYNPEYAYNGLKYQVEARNSSNVTFLAFKGETYVNHNGVNDAPVTLGFKNCNNVAVIGSEGLDWVEGGKGLIEFEGTATNYLIANKGRRYAGGSMHHPSHDDASTWYEIRDRTREGNGRIKISDPFVSVIKQGNPQLVAVEPQAGGGGGGGADSIAFAQTPPSTVEQGQSYDIHVDWSAADVRTVEVCLLLNSDPYSTHSNVVTKAATAGQSNSNDTFSVTVDADAPSPCRWRIRLLDGAGATVVSNVVHLNVAVNPPPTVDSIAFAQTPTSTVDQGGTYNIHVDWSAAGVRTVEVSLLKDSDPYSTHSNVITKAVTSGQSNSDDTFSVTVDSDAPDDCRWRIRLLDGAGATVVSNVVHQNVTVNAVNNAPSLNAISDFSVAEGGSDSVSLSASDPDGDTLSLSASGLPSFAILTDNGNGTGVIAIDPGYSDAGNYAITVTVNDGNGGTANDSFTLTVNNTNRAPSISSVADQPVEENTALSVNLSASDPDGNSLTFSGVSLPSFTSLIDNGNGTGSLNFNPASGDAGSYSVTVGVSDGITQVNTSFTLTVTTPPVSDSIAFAQTPPTTVDQGASYDIHVNWSAAAARTVEVSLILDSSPYSTHSNVVTKAVGAGQANTDDIFTVTVDTDAPSPCRWRIRMLDGVGATVVNNVVQTNVTVNVVSGDPLDGAIVTIQNVEFTNVFLYLDHDNTYPTNGQVESTSETGPYIDNNNFKWKLNAVSGQANVYTVESERAANRFLTSATNSAGNWRYASICGDGSGVYCEWQILNIEGDDYTIQNVGNGNRYLMRNGDDQGRVTDAANAWGGTGEWTINILSGGGGTPPGLFSGNNSIQSYEDQNDYATNGTTGADLVSNGSGNVWEFVHIGNEEYQIRSGSNYLEANNASGWQTIKQNAANGQDNQVWIIEEATGGAQGSGNFTVRSKVLYNGQDLHICYNNGNGKFFTTTGGMLWTSCTFIVE